MCAHVCGCVYAYTHTYTHTHVCVYGCVQMCADVCVFVFMCVGVCLCVRVCVCIRRKANTKYVCGCVQICVYAYIRVCVLVCVFVFAYDKKANQKPQCRILVTRTNLCVDVGGCGRMWGDACVCVFTCVYVCVRVCVCIRKEANEKTIVQNTDDWYKEMLVHDTVYQANTSSACMCAYVCVCVFV